MKNILKKKNIWIISIVIIFVVVIGYTITNNQSLFVDIVQAAEEQGEEENGECTGSSGNLYGYISTENLGSIFLSTESWNDANSGDTTSVNFYVNYDRQNGIWSGRGWNIKVGWVDFSYNQINDIVRFQLPGEYPNIWGGWNGEVDLSKVVYSSQNGSFQGDGNDAHNDTGGELDNIEDDYIGSGGWTFEGLQFQDPPCPQNVDLFLDGTSYLYRNNCDIRTPVIQWITEGVHSCESIEGLWSKKTRPSINTGINVKASADITEDNAPVLFKLRCIGNYSNSPVEGIAIASCGDAVPPGHGETGMISPTLIEA